MSVVGVVGAGFGLVLALVGVGLAFGGVALVRRTSRAPRERVGVEAVVVHRTSHVRPSSVTFDYPVPGGWQRAKRVEGLPATTPQGRRAQPGDRIVVWVDPHRPGDVRLSPGASPASMGGVALVLAGMMFLGFGLWFVTVTAGVLGGR